MTDYSQLYQIWPPIAILLIGLVAGWFLQRFVLVKQMEELETQHLDLLRSAEDEMHAARDEARLQGQKLDEAQLAITLGYERLTLLDRRLKEAEDRLLVPVAELAPAVEPEEMEQLRRKLADQQVFGERLAQLERDLEAAKTAALPEDMARMMRERDATIESLRHEVSEIEELRSRLSAMVTELGAVRTQAAQQEQPGEAGNQLVRKLADAIARRQELEVALGEANGRIVSAEAERDRALAAVSSRRAPRAMAAAAGSGSSSQQLGFTAANWDMSHSPASAPPGSARREDRDYVEPTIPLLSPAQLAGGLSQLLFENRIQFGTDRSDILTDSKLLMEDIADLILSSEPVRMVIEGHTERGDARAMFYLSERRAVSVMERLVKLGVPENRMMTVGYGDTRPIDENSSYEGRMRNRRVEIRILGRV